jgi:BTB/POZ domain-containing protein 1/2
MLKVLGDALNHIRFSLMTKEEFALIVKDESSRLIDESSIIDIFVNLTLNETSNYPKAVTNKPTKYTTTPRCCLSGKEQMINRFSQVESRWGYSVFILIILLNV